MKGRITGHDDVPETALPQQFPVRLKSIVHGRSDTRLGQLPIVEDENRDAESLRQRGADGSVRTRPT